MRDRQRANTRSAPISNATDSKSKVLFTQLQYHALSLLERSARSKSSGRHLSKVISRDTPPYKILAEGQCARGSESYKYVITAS
jgi:hypothetical protein